MADVSRKTYAIQDSGPYDEDEAREKIRAYCDEHGFFAAATLNVVEMRAASAMKVSMLPSSRSASVSPA
jgi:hypothetical protein